MSYAADAHDPSRSPWCAYHHGHYHWHPGLVIPMILGFIFWWPLGLAILGFIIWSKGMNCWTHGATHWQYKMERMQEKMDRMRTKMERFGSPWGGYRSSGNRAFDDYRSETLRRLEEEEKEFRDFLNRLRAAKDKSEFDQFMAERRNRSGTPPQEPTQG
jgi:Protein of unknown function (DUF2852)